MISKENLLKRLEISQREDEIDVWQQNKWVTSSLLLVMIFE